MVDPTSRPTEIRALRKDQVERFDKDFISDERFAGICECIDRDFPSGRFTCLDIGGGIGAFMDRLLERYPEAKGHVLDNADRLLSKNVPLPNKQTHLGSVEAARGMFPDADFDIVFFNFSLHHFVVSSYRRTRRIQRQAIVDATALLKRDGRLSIIENFCDGYFGSLSGFLIFTLTSSKVAAPLVRRLGAKTAGTGVCYLDRRGWLREIQKAGCEPISVAVDASAPDWSRVRKRLLFIRDLRPGHFWARCSK